MEIVQTPERFRERMPFNYPVHQSGLLIEEYFYEYATRNRDHIETDLCYLPIFWTSYHVSHNWGNSYQELQNFCDSLPKDKTYFTVVQYDDGVRVSMPNLITFSCCGNSSSILKDFPIPLLCDPHGAKWEKDVYKASFIGRIGSRVRPKMFEILTGLPGFYLRDSGDDVTLFLDHLQQSTFSLCPRGYGVSSFRLYETLEVGSIPIYIVEDDVDHWLPFSDKVDWDKLAVLLKESEIENIPRIVDSMTIEEIEERRSYINEIYPKFFTMEGCSSSIIEKIKEFK